MDQEREGVSKCHGGGRGRARHVCGRSGQRGDSAGRPPTGTGGVPQGPVADKVTPRVLTRRFVKCVPLLDAQMLGLFSF